MRTGYALLLVFYFAVVAAFVGHGYLFDDMAMLRDAGAAWASLLSR